MQSGRLKSSFIYLANAVNDLTGNWVLIGLTLAPLVVVASLCLLPDALNLQHQLVQVFESNLHQVGWSFAQAPYRPISPAPVTPLVPHWITLALHLLFGLVTLTVNLVVLCMLARLHRGELRPRLLNETLEIYRRAIELFPAFLWVVFLQLIATAIGFVLLIIPGFLAFVWLYFAQYALVFDERRSWPALLYSRDLMRGRFLKTAVRIVVFLAVWSGYNSWAGGLFIGVSLLLGALGAITGFLWAGVFVGDLLAVAVAYTTTAFFFAAGVRLFRDLEEPAAEFVAVPQAADHPTAPLSSTSF